MALVFIANIVPGILMKSSAPYWFDRVSYKARIRACALLMCGSYLLVGISSTLALQLLGVALASTQSSMGEASLLALATRYPRPSNNSSEALVSKFDGNETHGKEKSDAGPTLTAWSSGTGFAGVFGFAWVALFDDVFGLPSRVGLFAALSFAIVWLILFLFLVLLTLLAYSRTEQVWPAVGFQSSCTETSSFARASRSRSTLLPSALTTPR